MGSEGKNQEQWHGQNASDDNGSIDRRSWQRKSWKVGAPFASEAKPPSTAKDWKEWRQICGNRGQLLDVSGHRVSLHDQPWRLCNSPASLEYQLGRDAIQCVVAPVVDDVT